MPQPAITSDASVLLTVGFVCHGERSEIVLPIGTDTPPADPTTLCSAAVGDFVAQALPDLLNALSTDLYTSFVQAEAMVLGNIPFREDFGPTDNPGVVAHVAMPNNVAGLLSFYLDHQAAVSTSRQRVGKNYIPGIPVTEVIGDVLKNTTVALLQNFVQDLVVGYSNTPGLTWYRVGKLIRATAQSVPNILLGEVRSYLATQRRRLLPH